MIYQLLNFLVTLILLLSSIGYTKEVLPVDPNVCKMTLLNNKEALSNLFEAIDQDDSKELLALYNAYWDLRTIYQNTQTLLYYAAFLGQAKSIQIIVNDFGAQINKKDKNSWTALHYAIFNTDMDLSSRVNTIYTLVELGTNIYKSDKLGHKPSDYVVINDQKRSSPIRYSQKQKDKISDLALNILDINNRQEIARLFQIKLTTLINWIYLYKKANGLSRPIITYTQKAKEEAIQQALKLGISIRQAAKELDIPYAVLFHWFHEYASEKVLKTLDPKTVEAIKLSLQTSMSQASKKLGIPYNTVQYRMHKYKKDIKLLNPSSYSAEDQKKAIRLSLQIGRAKASKKLGIPYTTIRNWETEYKKKNKQQDKKSSSLHLSFYSPKKKAEAMELAFEIGTKEAAHILDIPYNTLRYWRGQQKKRQGLQRENRSSYSLDDKAKAVILALRTSIDEAAQQLDISSNTLRHWVRQYKEEHGLPVQKKSSHSIQEQIEAIKLAYQVGIEKASETLNINYNTLRFWVYRYEKEGQPEQMIQYIPNPSQVASELEHIEKLRQQTALQNIIFKASLADKVKQAIAKELAEGELTIEAAIKDYNVSEEELIYWVNDHRQEAY